MTDEQFWERVRQIALAETAPPISNGSHPGVQHPEAVAERSRQNRLSVLLERSALFGDMPLSYSTLRTYVGMTDRSAVWPDDWSALVWDAISHVGAAGESDRFEFLQFSMAVERGEWWSLVSPGRLPAILFDSPDQPTSGDGARLQKLVEWSATRISDSSRELQVFINNGGSVQCGESVGYGFDMGARRVRTHHSDVLRAVATRSLPAEWRWEVCDLFGGGSNLIITGYLPPRVERISPDWRRGSEAVVVELTGGRLTAPLVGDAAAAAVGALRTGRVVTKAEMAAWGVR